MDNKDIFSKNLKYYMDIHNKTRKQICQDLGFSYYTFSDWVNGKKYPRMDKVEILANYFNILKSDLIEEKHKPTKIKQPTINDSHFEISNEIAIYEDLRRWNEEVGETHFTDEELSELMNYAKYILNKRKVK